MAVERTISQSYKKDRINGGGWLPVLRLFSKQGKTFSCFILLNIWIYSIFNIYSNVRVMLTSEDPCLKTQILGKPEKYFYHFYLRLLN